MLVTRAGGFGPLDALVRLLAPEGPTTGERPGEALPY
ncbi:hypothetical protein BH24ACT5_BH24ACT5_31390 [soil metagenome]